MRSFRVAPVLPVLDMSRLPRHVAIIMDGNRRWARDRRLPAIEGHRRGIVALRNVTRAARDLGIPIVTAYGFSTENWRRDSAEISLLLDLCVYFAKTELAELQRNNVRVNVIGRFRALPRASREALEDLAARTASNDGLLLNLAVNYSGRTEFADAAAALATDVEAGRVDPGAIDEALIATYLSTGDLPDPDLLIRPGGESRLSNFLLFQLAHAELHVSDVFWPDFTHEHLVRAVADYQGRAPHDGAA
jgi:undecaprenyl diphosphate synthase